MNSVLLTTGTDIVLLLVLLFLIVNFWATSITQDSGPFNLFVRLRRSLEHIDWWDEGINCPICVGFWVSWVVALIIYPLGGSIYDYILTASALAGANSLWERR